MISNSSPSVGRSVAVKPVKGSVGSKKMRGKVPKKIHKAEREKLKRDHLNELFLELSHSLDPSRQNNGKATILSDATKILRDLITQVGSLKRENAALLNESHYVTVEKKEVEDDNAALHGDIDRLQKQIEESIMIHDPSEKSPVAPVIVVPLSENLPQTLADMAAPLSSSPMASPAITRPHARYPTADSWSLEFLSRNLEASRDKTFIS